MGGNMSKDEIPEALPPIEKLDEGDRLAFREQALLVENVELRQRIVVLEIELAQAKGVILTYEAQNLMGSFGQVKARICELLHDRGQDPDVHIIDLSTGIVSKKP